MEPVVITSDSTHRALRQEGVGLGSSRRVAFEKRQPVLERIGECGPAFVINVSRLIWLRI
jgi:hypothetical protein